MVSLIPKKNGLSLWYTPAACLQAFRSVWQIFRIVTSGLAWRQLRAKLPQLERAYTHTYIHRYIYIYICIHVCVQKIYIYIYMHTYVYVCISIKNYKRMYTNMYLYVHISNRHSYGRSFEATFRQLWAISSEVSPPLSLGRQKLSKWTSFTGTFATNAVQPIKGSPHLRNRALRSPY